jgi:hypothetical protein
LGRSASSPTFPNLPVKIGKNSSSKKFNLLKI